MSNIFDYLDWRGDITFNEVKLNKLDALIFAHLAYSFFDGLVPADFKKTKKISKFAEDFTSAPDYKKRTSSTFLKNKKTAELTQRLAQTKRFCDVKITGFRNLYNEEKTEQFAAVTFIVDDTVVVSFRGTDDTIAGWREDFNIAWQDPIPSGVEAINYLKEAAENFSGNIIVTGHSKGGHLAVLSSARCGTKIQKRIKEIYNFDGPGFPEAIYENSSYKKISAKIKSVYPTGSIVGMIFHHPENFEIVESSSFSLKEHNALTWQLMGSEFVTAKKFEKPSVFFHKSFNEWIEKLSYAQRKEFVTALFDVIEASEAKTASELEDNLIVCSTKMLAKLSAMDKDKKREVKKILKILNDVIVNSQKS